MGLKLIEFYNKIKISHKIAFISALVLGLCVHIYKFTNTLPNHDSVFNYHQAQNVVASGRWFLAFTCAPSSFYDLPWIVGLFSVIFLGLVSAVIVEIFKIENPILIILTSGILCAFPSVTETFFFEYTADGYMLAMLLAALSVYFSRFNTHKKRYYVLSAVCICLTCATYQAYVSFALVLAICYFLVQLFEDKYSIKEYLRWIRNQIIIYASALVSYVVLWKLCMFVEKTKATGYQGIDQTGSLGLSSIINGFYASIKSILKFFFECNIFKYGITVYGALNILFFVLFAVAIVTAVIKSKSYKSAFKIVLTVISLAIIPFAVCIWHFTSDSVVYEARMMGSTVVLYIFAAVLMEKYSSVKAKNITGLLLAAIIINNGLQANICYYYMNRCYEQTYADTLEMVMKIREVNSDKKASKLAVTGDIQYKAALDKQKEGRRFLLLSHTLDETLAFNHLHTSLFMQNTFNIDLEAVTKQEAYELAQTRDVRDMSCWPDDGSVKVIGDTVVVKLDEFETMKNYY